MYHYEGKAYYPGPTLVLKPGTKCSVSRLQLQLAPKRRALKRPHSQINLINSLDNSSSGSSDCSFSNSFHCAEATNLHIFGLQFQDMPYIIESVKPGQNITLDYDIPLSVPQQRRPRAVLTNESVCGRAASI